MFVFVLFAFSLFTIPLNAISIVFSKENVIQVLNSNLTLPIASSTYSFTAEVPDASHTLREGSLMYFSCSGVGLQCSCSNPSNLQGAIALVNVDTFSPNCNFNAFLAKLNPSHPIAVIFNVTGFPKYDQRFSIAFDFPVILALNNSFNLLYQESQQNSALKVVLLTPETEVQAAYEEHISLLSSFRVFTAIVQGSLLLIIGYLMIDVFVKRMMKVLIRQNFSLDFVLFLLFLTVLFRFFNVVIDPFSSSGLVSPFSNKMMEELNANSLVSVYIMIAAIWLQVWKEKTKVEELQKKILIPAFLLIASRYVSVLLFIPLYFSTADSTIFLVYTALLAVCALLVLIVFTVLTSAILIRLRLSSDVNLSKKLNRFSLFLILVFVGGLTLILCFFIEAFSSDPYVVIGTLGYQFFYVTMETLLEVTILIFVRFNQAKEDPTSQFCYKIGRTIFRSSSSSKTGSNPNSNQSSSKTKVGMVDIEAEIRVEDSETVDLP